MQLMQILKSKVTRYAILYTMLIIVVYRIGSFIVAPGTSDFLISNAESLSGGLGGLFDFFGGGKLSSYSLFMLGVSPYITASIVVQLLETDIIPSMAEWKQQGIDGQNKRSNLTKQLAVIFAIVQSFGIIMATTLQQIKFSQMLGVNSPLSLGQVSLMILCITAGVCAMMWMADRITEKGVGNGISVVIMVGIVSSMPATFDNIYKQYFLDTTQLAYNTILWTIIFIIQILLILIVIYYSLAKRKIEINYVKSSSGKINQNSYIPIKINPAGVIPVIFVLPIMMIPIIMLNYIPWFSSNGIGWMEQIVRAFFDTTTSNDFWYCAATIKFIFIVLFSVFYSHVQMNPQSMTENLEKQAGYIVGVRPGVETKKYLEKIILQTSLWGGITLAVIATIPTIVTQVANVTSQGISLSLLGTGLIITVSVIVQTYEALLNKTESKVYRKLFGVKK